jgi:anti-anti-sigma factor
MDITKEKYRDILVEVVNLKSATYEYAVEFKNILAKEIESGWVKIIVDLSKCHFIDSTFLGALVISLKKVNQLKGDLLLVMSQTDVNSMFQLTKLNTVFATYKTKDDAIKSFILSENPRAIRNPISNFFTNKNFFEAV